MLPSSDLSYFRTSLLEVVRCHGHPSSLAALMQVFTQQSSVSAGIHVGVPVQTLFEESSIRASCRRIGALLFTSVPENTTAIQRAAARLCAHPVRGMSRARARCSPSPGAAAALQRTGAVKHTCSGAASWWSVMTGPPGCGLQVQ